MGLVYSYKTKHAGQPLSQKYPLEILLLGEIKWKLKYFEIFYLSICIAWTIKLILPRHWTKPLAQITNCRRDTKNKCTDYYGHLVLNAQLRFTGYRSSAQIHWRTMFKSGCTWISVRVHAIQLTKFWIVLSRG